MAAEVTAVVEGSPGKRVEILLECNNSRHRSVAETLSDAVRERFVL